MSQRYLGGFITANPVQPTSTTAKGEWTLQQQMQAQAAYNWPGPPQVIGQPYGGGYYAGKISTTSNGVATHYLIVSPKSSGQSPTYLRWKTANTTTAGTSSDIDGPTNSANMNNASHPAAQFCEALTIGGYTDWYLPAKNELEVLYYNLKPTTAGNSTTSGSNANAVSPEPISTNYSSGSPAQTSVTAFQTGNPEAFISSGNLYWSSTQLDATYAWNQYFADGDQRSNEAKNLSNPVRAVRRIPI